MTSTVASAISPVAADCPIASPSAKLCRPMPTAISRVSRLAGDQVATPRLAAVLSVGRHCAGPSAASVTGTTRDVAVVSDQSEQTDGEAGREKEPVTDRAAQAATARVHVGQRSVDWLPRRRSDIPEQEQKDAHGDCIEDDA